jgi:hypothetical protein
MHELTCPGCGSPSQYNIEEVALMCSYCSATFRYNIETGQKDIFNDHFIVPNTIDAVRVKDTVLEWLRRLHHKPGNVEKEYVVLDIRGTSIPFWVVSLEIHTAWSGLVERNRRAIDTMQGAEYLSESGTFRRSYRWAINARNNICENWGMARIHEPKEPVTVVWDGFPLDSTFSRGRMSQELEGEKSAYETREFFEFKYANSLPILGVQVGDNEAVRRARTHVEWYHYNLAQMHADYLLDCRHEIDIAGVQLIHLPFWHATYVYRPANALRHFYKPVAKHVTIEGIRGGILKGELGLIHRDKVQVNAVITAGCSLFFFLLGAVWNPSFFLVALFFGAVSGLSAYIAMIKLEERKRQVNHITPESAKARVATQDLYA